KTRVRFDDGRQLSLGAGILREVDDELVTARSTIHTGQAAPDILRAAIPPYGDELGSAKTRNARLILIARRRAVERELVHRLPPTARWGRASPCHTPKERTAGVGS